MTPRNAIAPGANHSPSGVGPGYCAKPDRHHGDTGRPPLLTFARASISSVSSGSSSYSVTFTTCLSTREKSDFKERGDAGLFAFIGFPHLNVGRPHLEPWIAAQTRRAEGRSPVTHPRWKFGNYRIQLHGCPPWLNRPRTTSPTPAATAARNAPLAPRRVSPTQTLCPHRCAA